MTLQAHYRKKSIWDVYHGCYMFDSLAHGLSFKSPIAYWRFSAADNCLIRYSAFDAAERSGCNSNPNNLAGGFERV